MAGKFAEMSKLICVHCGAYDSLLGDNGNNGQICNKCLLASPTNGQTKCDTDDKNGGGDGVEAKAANQPKGTSKHKAKTLATSASKSDGNDESGHKNIFERPLTAPLAPAAVVTSDYIFYEGIIMQAGDIVTITDVEGLTYYAQIRSFFTDQHDEKSATITWLFPTRASPHPELGFDPATYMIGPEEHTPRKMEYMQFVMHLSPDFYKDRNILFPLTDAEIDRGYG